MKLGPVDGFDEDEAASEGDESRVALGRLLAAECDLLEALELAHGLLDPRPALIEDLREESGLGADVRAIRDDRADTALSGRPSVGLGVVALVGQRGPRRDVGADVEQGLELAAVAGLGASQVERERLAIEVSLEVDLGAKATARAAQRLAVLPPLAPAAETCARTAVLSNICTRYAVGLRSASAWKNASNTPARLSRQNRFQTEFQWPHSAGKARQVMLWTVK